MLKIQATERIAALKALPDWQYDSARDAIIRDFKFNDFTEAFAFMTKVAALAEAANHHPEWSNIYSKVTILLITHTASGLTQKDIELAKAIDAL